MTNAIVADLGKTRHYTCDPVFQYNKGMMLQITGIELPEAYEVHFSNDIHGAAKVRVGNADGVRVPYEYFVPGKDIYCWLYLHPTEDSSVTVAVITIPVSARARIINDEPLPEEQTAIEAMVTALNEAVDRVEEIYEEIPETVQEILQQAKDSGEFDGQPGFSPIVDVSEITGGHHVAITDASGVHPFDIMNGKDGETPDTSVYALKTELPTKVSDLVDDSGHYTKPANGIPASDLAAGVIPQIPTKVSDLVDDSGHYTKPSGGIPESDLAERYIKTTDYSTSSKAGVSRVNSSNGIGINTSNTLYINKASDTEVRQGVNSYKPLVPNNQHLAVFYGLSKAALVPPDTYSDNAKTAIQTMLGVPSKQYVDNAVSQILDLLNQLENDS